MVLDKSACDLGIVMANIAWELLTVNLIVIGISTVMPYTMLFDHHFSRFILGSQTYKITIKQPRYCHEN